MIGSGRFNRQVQIRRALLLDDGYTRVDTWVDAGMPQPASKRDISDAERLRAAEIGATVTTRFVIRWSNFAATVTPKDRLICEGREYEISGVKEIGRREGLEITAAARSDQ